MQGFSSENSRPFASFAVQSEACVSARTTRLTPKEISYTPPMPLAALAFTFLISTVQQMPEPWATVQKVVGTNGTINKDTDRDRGWTVELAFPWANMKWLATDGRALPPQNGDVWRLDFSRFNTYKEAPPAKDSGGWFWTRHGVWDSHIPECFVFVTFSTNLVVLDQTSAREPCASAGTPGEHVRWRWPHRSGR